MDIASVMFAYVDDFWYLFYLGWFFYVDVNFFHVKEYNKW